MAVLGYPKQSGSSSSARNQAASRRSAYSASANGRSRPAASAGCSRDRRTAARSRGTDPPHAAVSKERQIPVRLRNHRSGSSVTSSSRRPSMLHKA